ncbi:MULTISPECIES: MmgE/PrpD family protein [Streptomyces]|uniref:MmgE/PrpD family protein n=1 Tax=Streptomyces cinereoruber TaxID=67260 RepID=A0ABX6BL91_9ACTN|nr:MULTISPECIES: MmgE/PrpD family protein [Streptomyces]AVH94177.1 MmgE/PrpD family protein [Streptomyces sp. WAC00288]KYG51400.1 2-methylcitrate dehydratase [Streptomyces sp. WAC04657]QEV36077.1 MmgE/PrpD family protein [Streptomyces cinereoruber]
MQTTLPVEAAAARLVAELDHDSLPPEVVRGARRLLQDQLAVQIGCADLPWSRAVLDLTRSRHVPGGSRVVLTGDMMSAADAAFVNATFGHGFEYDDAHRASSSHPGSCVVSTALAVGEELGATMRDVLLGIVAGYEIYTRIGVLAAPELLERGFHPHAVLSNLGAAAVVAKMRGFDLERTIHALAIATSHCSGTTEYTSSGGSVKRVHAGIGTRNGIRAAEMAEAGITGPLAFLTGSKGFYRTFVGREVAADAADAFSPDAPFEIERVWIKPYCCCGINHAYIDGARRFSDRVELIESVELDIQTGGNVIVGTRNVNAYAPQSIENLQYSLPFQFALSLLGRGNGYLTHRAYLDGELDLSSGGEVAELAHRIHITPKPELDARYAGKWVGNITVTYRDGSTESLFVESPLGTAENPMPQADLDAKFRDLTVTVMGAEQSEELLRTITEGDNDVPAATLTKLLVV